MNNIKIMHETKKGWCGHASYNGEQCFVKHINEDFLEEVNGYNHVKDLYIVPKLYHIDYENQNIYFEFISNFDNKTLHHTLSKGKTVNIKSLLSSYAKAFNTIKYENSKTVPNERFFYQRASHLNEYILRNKELFDKSLKINDKPFESLKNIFNEMHTALSQEKQLLTFITQGDPTDMNITNDGYLIDFETGGFNSLVGEIAIFVNCFFINGTYFFAKYQNSSYYGAKKLLDERHFTITTQETGNEIKINFKIKIPHANKIILLEYLEFFSSNLTESQVSEIDKYLRYYLPFRMVTPKNVDIFERNDKFLALGIMCELYNKATTLKNLKEYINSLESF